MGVNESVDISPKDRNTIIALLNRYLPDTITWVYGSRVRWSARPNSDLDMVVFSNSEQKLKVSELKDAFDESNLPYRVDLFVWDEVPEPFKKNIEKEHVVLVGGGFGKVGDLTEGWRKTNLENIGDVKSGKRLPKGDVLVNNPTPYPYIRLVDISDGYIRKNDLKYLLPVTREKISHYIVNKQDVCLAIVGHTIGLVFFVEDEWDGVNLTENAARITNIKKEFNSKFIYYFLTSPIGHQEILLRKVGSAQGKLPLYNIKTIEIPTPHKSEQDKIVFILDCLNDKIELNRQMNETLEDMAQVLFKSWFVDFDPVIDKALAAGNSIPDSLQAKAAVRKALGGDRKPLPESVGQQFPSRFVFSEEMKWIPDGWEVKTIGSIIELAYGKPLPANKRIKGDTPVFGSGGLSGFHNKKLVDGPGIVVGRKGTVGSLYWIEKDFFPIDTVFYVKKKLEAPLYWIYQSLFCIDIKSLGADSAVPGVNRNAVYSRSIIVPSSSILNEYSTLIGPNNKKRSIIEQQKCKLTTLRNTLLPKLLSGKLRIPDAEKLVRVGS